MHREFEQFAQNHPDTGLPTLLVDGSPLQEEAPDLEGPAALYAECDTA